MGSSFRQSAPEFSSGSIVARIVYISKYPPLQGGIAAKTYWLVQALAKRGHEIHVVTDRTDVDKMYMVPGLTSIPSHADVSIHRPQHEAPWHIPYDPHRSISLLNEALAVVDKIKPDVMIAGYLVPYGLTAYLVNQLHGIPYVLFHGGSDIQKFVQAGIWSHLWKEVFSKAKWVVTDANQSKEIERWTERYRVLAPYVPDPAIFMAGEKTKRKRPILALIGKANYYWQQKGWSRVIDIWSMLNESFEFVVISQGIGLKRFQSYAKKHLDNRINWRPFVAPWEMPSLLRSIDALFHFETDLPFPIFSNLVIEALYCGIPVVIDKKDLIKRYSNHGLDLRKRTKFVLDVPHQDAKHSVEKIKEFFSMRFDDVSSFETKDYDKYITACEEIFST